MGFDKGADGVSEERFVILTCVDGEVSVWLGYRLGGWYPVPEDDPVPTLVAHLYLTRPLALITVERMRKHNPDAESAQNAKVWEFTALWKGDQLDWSKIKGEEE